MFFMAVIASCIIYTMCVSANQCCIFFHTINFEIQKCHHLKAAKCGGDIVRIELQTAVHFF